MFREVTLCLTFIHGFFPVYTCAEDKDKSWTSSMKKVHSTFTGKKGTFAHFGDSITVSMAFWAPLRYEPKNMSPEMAKALEKVAKHMRADCWNKWKGSQFGNDGGMTIRWAHEHVDQWLKKHNPETALIMFGTNDLGALEAKEYEDKTREVVRRCLKNGTVVILTTPPPRHGYLEKSKSFAAVVKKIAQEEKVPLVDYFGEILQRRPEDWNGALPKFKDLPGDEYQVPTLIARDGVHPSYPKSHQNYSEESLRCNGYALRNYLTLMKYAEVVESVLK